METDESPKPPTPPTYQRGPNLINIEQLVSDSNAQYLQVCQTAENIILSFFLMDVIRRRCSAYFCVANYMAAIFIRYFKIQCFISLGWSVYNSRIARKIRLNTV